MKFELVATEIFIVPLLSVVADGSSLASVKKRRRISNFATLLDHRNEKDAMTQGPKIGNHRIHQNQKVKKCHNLFGNFY